MRVAVLGDIHGNLRALEAVQTDLSKRAPDVVVNLGDHLSGPLQAAATADLLMQESYIHIRGNHDRQLLDRPPDAMGQTDRATYGQLDSRHTMWLRGLPATKMLGEDVLLCHGSPEDDLEYLLEEVDEYRVHLASPEQIRRRLGNAGVPLVLCGHSHIPRTVLLPGGVWVVNPGSVGVQAYKGTWTSLHYVDTGSPHARYAIIDREAQTLKVDFIAVEYDWEAAAKEAAAANRLNWAHALATGYALRP